MAASTTIAHRSSSHPTHVPPPLNATAPRIRVSTQLASPTLPSFFRHHVDVHLDSFGREKNFEIYDLSKLPQHEAVSSPGLKVVNMTGVFASGTCFLGFGLPNVFLADVRDEGIFKVDAKSCNRAPMQVVETRGRVQSGYFFVPIGLAPEAVERARQRAREREGSSDITCVRTNTSVLADAGFTIDGHNPTYILPHDLFAAILAGKLHFNGTPFSVAICRTVDVPLGTFYKQIVSAVRGTPLRHWRNRYDTLEAQQDRLEAARATPANALPPRLLASADMRTFQLRVAQPSCIGGFARRLWGSHPIYLINLASAGIAIREHLPTTLRAFPQANPSLLTRLKRDCLFSQPVVAFLRSHVAARFGDPIMVDEAKFLSMMATHSDSQQNVYNIVVTSSDLLVVKNTVAWAFIDWILSKHVLTCGYSSDVRFAGELWKLSSDELTITRNSGTYCPTAAQLGAAVGLALALFPRLTIKTLEPPADPQSLPHAQSMPALGHAIDLAFEQQPLLRG